jgi:hypothetical protein
VIYETEEDRQREWDIAMVVAVKAGATLVRSPRLACYDFIAMRDGKEVAVIEVKATNYTLAQARTWPHGVMVDPDKARKLVAESTRRGVKLVFIYGFTDAITILPLDGEWSEPIEDGRTDRGARGRRLYLHFPVSSLQIIAARSAAAG